MYFLVEGRVSFSLTVDNTSDEHNAMAEREDGGGQSLGRSKTLQMGGSGSPETKARSNRMSLHSQDNILYKMMTNGSYFGDLDIITKSKRTDRVLATTNCDMYTLSRSVGAVHRRTTRIS